MRLLTACAGVMGMLMGVAMAQEATVTVRVDRPGAAVPASLYGIFFEEINHAGDGGLYAELIQNRSFDETIPVEGCTLKDDKCVAPALPHYVSGQVRNWSVPWKYSSPHPAWVLEGEGAISIQRERPLNAANPTYLRLTTGREPGAAGRLINEGYWGISVVAGETYDLSFFAREPSARVRSSLMKMRVGLIDPAGKVLASQDIELTSEEWKQYACSLTSGATERKARFFLQPLFLGTLDLEFVSLFPRKTFKNRPNGCRADLAQLLAELKPAFVRFPGGCVVEGATMENRWQWKKTIGPVHARPGHWSLWKYRNTDGLGYHEFLQLCEDIGAQGMLVINCGLACEYRNGDYWPDERLPELIQDTLDAIEYALGPATSRWGGERVKAGHPEPLPLKYVEIGNENHGPNYVERYHRFAEAIKKAWPQLTLICNVKVDGTEMEDPHFYVGPSFFFENHRRFDTAPRKDAAGRPAPRVYVGEFAVNREVGSGNLLAALSEAAFMMGMERNGDLVHLCSYAPLLFNVNRLDWPVNMIGYDSAVSFGRSSYYAQKMFATNLPERNVACEASAPPMTLPGQRGQIGVGTWQTQAEFKEIRVTDASGKKLLASDFAKGMGGFRPIDGEWSVADGVLRQSGSATGTRAVAGDRKWADYTLSLKARKTGGREGFLILFAADQHSKSWWNLGGWGNKQHGLEAPGIDAPRVEGTIETGRWYDIRIEVGTDRIRCFLDDKLVHDVARQLKLPSVYAVAGVAKDGEIIVKVVNAATEARATRFRIEGAGSVRPQARLITLSHADATAENSIEAPCRIVPVETTIDTAKTDFSLTLPANSISVLRLRPGRP